MGSSFWVRTILLFCAMHNMSSDIYAGIKALRNLRWGCGVPCARPRLSLYFVLDGNPTAVNRLVAGSIPARGAK